MKKLLVNPLMLIVLLVFFITSCKKSDTTTPTYTVKLATSPTLGQYLVDKDGYSLYYYSNDYNGRNSCSGGCAAIWPYFYAGNLTQGMLGAGLSLSDFDTIVVSGTNQTRYKGWPLYYYAPTGTSKEAPGQTSGEAFGGIWFVAKPDYSIMLANTQLVGLDGNSYTSTYTMGTGKTVYFTNPWGLTLYTFTVDSANHNKFTKSDFSNNSSWPIYDTTLIVVPSVLDKTLFTNTTVFGKNQLTYNGWPLYYFGGDGKVRGNNKGVSVPHPGIWPVAVKGVTAAPHK